MNHASTPTRLLACLIVNQLGCGILLPTLVVWAMARLSFEVRGRGTGLFMGGWWIGQFLSPQAATLVRKLTGS
jgi:MFS family permease